MAGGARAFLQFASMTSNDWSNRAVRVGRAVARFKLVARPHLQAWEARRTAEPGTRCFGCDEAFGDESHYEIVVAQTLLMRLHDDCFEAWKKLAAGAPGNGGNGGGPAADDEA
jgi:hypothetical protein